MKKKIFIVDFYQLFWFLVNSVSAQRTEISQRNFLSKNMMK